MSSGLRFIFGLCLCLSLGITSVVGQEICDNGIDDDGDGLIDLNDDDCICLSFIKSSLIPNPSFEDKTCCPKSDAMLNCAVDWIQASAPTSDYVHTCGGYLGNSSIQAEAPLPFPDGEGGVGFRDGQFFVGPNYKEYVGACLTREMTIGKSYRLDFFVGFQKDVRGSDQFKLGIFGSNDCRNLPFGGNSNQVGCPVNTGRYNQLAEIDVSGNNGWVNVTVDFVADDVYEVIVLGPGCGANPNYTLDPYFYVDRLALEETGKFGVPLDTIGGSICKNDLVIAVTNDPDRTYQWYKDGVALVGETAHKLVLQNGPNVEGVYVVTITSAEGCFLSKEYVLRVPPYYAPLDTAICDGEVVSAGGQMFSDSGYYEITIPARDGCDSIIQLSIEVNQNSSSVLYDTFCIGDVYRNLGIETADGGTFTSTLINHVGCDSLVEIRLTQINSINLIDLDQLYQLKLGENIDIKPRWIDPSIVKYEWYSEDGILLSEASELIGFRAINSGSITLWLFDRYGCEHQITVAIEVTKENIRLFVPNVFTPNGDNLNDFFNFFSTEALSQVNFFRVYDRWGELIYNAPAFVDPTSFVGWDGTFNGEAALPGVYTYVLSVTYLDETDQLISGDLTLLR